MEFVFFAFIWALAGFVNGISGMGAALMAVPFMTLFMDIQLIVPIACIMVTILSSVLAIKYRSEFHLRIVLPAIICAIPGALIGAYILRVVSPIILEIFMSLFLITYVIWSFLHKYSYSGERNSFFVGGVCGFASGLFGSTISFTGPPLAIFILYTGWKQQKALGALGVALILITGTSCISHFLAGFYTKEFLQYIMIGVPAGICGMFLSFPLIKYITQSLFKKILLVVIGFAGLMCAFKVIQHFI